MTKEERNLIESRIEIYRRLQSEAQQKHEALLEAEILDIRALDDCRFSMHYHGHSADLLTELLHELDQLSSEERL